MIILVFDMDEDLTKDFNEIVTGKKKSKDKITDFEFSEKNAKTLDFGFKTTAIKDGADIIKKSQKSRGR